MYLISYCCFIENVQYIIQKSKNVAKMSNSGRHIGVIKNNKIKMTKRLHGMNNWTSKGKGQ